MNAGEHSGRQAGAVLVVGLILLTLVTLVGFGSIRSSVMELRMANNAEIKSAAFHQAQAGLDYLFARPELLPVRSAGYTNCTASLQNGRTPCHPYWSPCNEHTLDLPDPLDDSADGPAALQTTLSSAGVPRGFATSGRVFEGMSFAVRSCYDDVAGGRGNSAVNAGVVILTPKM